MHGYGLSFAKATAQTTRVAFDLNLPVVPVSFNWTSHGTFWSYERDRRAAEECAEDLAAFLRECADHLPRTKIHLGAHSLGARVVCHAIARLATDPAWNDAPAELENIVLLAPNVDQGDFDRAFRPHLTRLARHLTVYVASNDRLLLVARAGFGDNPLTLDTGAAARTQADEAAAALALARGEPAVQLIDATFVTQPDFTRHRYQRAPAVLADLHWLLKGHPAGTARNLLPSARPGQPNVWILPPD